MNNERYNQIIDEAWHKYLQETMFDSNPKWLEPIPGIDSKTGKKIMGARQYHKNDFLEKCITDTEFSERWELKIEERELRFEERYDWYINTHNKNITRGSNQYDMGVILNTNNCPTKLITVTYQENKIEVYE